MKKYIYFTLLGVLIHFKNITINPLGIMDYSIGINYLPEFLSIFLLLVSGGLYLINKDYEAMNIGLIGFGLCFYDMLSESMELVLLKDNLDYKALLFITMILSIFLTIKITRYTPSNKKNDIDNKSSRRNYFLAFLPSTLFLLTFIFMLTSR